MHMGFMPVSVQLYTMTVQVSCALLYERRAVITSSKPITNAMHTL